MTLSTITCDSSFRPVVLPAGTGIRNRGADSRWLVIRQVGAVEEVGLHDDGRPWLAVAAGCRTNHDIAALHRHPDVSARAYQSASRSFLEASSD